MEGLLFFGSIPPHLSRLPDRYASKSKLAKRLDQLMECRPTFAGLRFSSNSIERHAVAIETSEQNPSIAIVPSFDFVETGALTRFGSTQRRTSETDLEKFSTHHRPAGLDYPPVFPKPKQKSHGKVASTQIGGRDAASVRGVWNRCQSRSARKRRMWERTVRNIESSACKNGDYEPGRTHLNKSYDFAKDAATGDARTYEGFMKANAAGCSAT
jgi:hypothetical protein